MPQDLIYQAVAESGFQPQARNGRSGAGGMWQFMPGDAFAPPRSAWYDQRYDPEQSTRAYARYIKYLYNQLGDWYLAMAAYDWGAGNVQRAVQRTGYADFWELYRRNVLPTETKNYVPIILAATIMAKNPRQYGLDSVVADPPLLTDTVTTNYSVDLRLVSDIVEAPLQEIVALNPSLLRMATPPDDSFALHLPPGTKQLFTSRIEEIPVDRRRSWRFHKVAAGETIAGRRARVPREPPPSSPSSISSTPPAISPAPKRWLFRWPRSPVLRSHVPPDTPPRRATRWSPWPTGSTYRWTNSAAGTTSRARPLRPGHMLYVSEPARVTSPRAHRGKTAPHPSAKASTRSLLIGEPQNRHRRLLERDTRPVPRRETTSFFRAVTHFSLAFIGSRIMLLL